MYFNMHKQTMYILEVVDPKSQKHYSIHVYSSVANEWPLEGLHCVELYITDQNPHHDVLVGYWKKAFTPEEYAGGQAVRILNKMIFAKLPKGIKRFEAIMAHGIKGNELKF